MNLFIKKFFIDIYIEQEYGLILYFIGLGLAISLILYLVSYILIYKNINKEKLMAYECGFNPFSDARELFDVRFYLVAILFIVFDLEIIYLLPWVLVLKLFTFFGFFAMVLFFIILLIGFMYEWFKGSLDWH